MFNSVWVYEMQHTRFPCTSLSPGVCSVSCPLSQWCHPTISSSVIPFSSCPQSLPASRSFPMSQLFASGGQSIGVSASASVLPMNTQDWSPLGWTGSNVITVQGTLKSLLQHHSLVPVYSRAGGIWKQMYQCANYSSFQNLRPVVVLSWVGLEATTLLGVKKNDTETLGKVNWSVSQEWHCLTLVGTQYENSVWRLLHPNTPEAWLLSSRRQFWQISKGL